MGFRRSELQTFGTVEARFWANDSASAATQGAAPSGQFTSVPPCTATAPVIATQTALVSYATAATGEMREGKRHLNHPSL